MLQRKIKTFLWTRQASGNTQTGENGNPSVEAASASASAGENLVSLEKLNDFDYLIQHYYTVDKSTTINSSQLVVQNLLNKNCTIQKTTEDVPQILIYHTHGSEGYADSVEGDPNTSVIAVGNRLTQILQDTYGYHVLHDTGIYDTDRDHAYNVAAPAIQKILQDHPSIEVVIDLHRDGVADTTRLATNINGVDMAQVMFFNGLSKTTATGDIDYLRNPYIGRQSGDVSENAAGGDGTVSGIYTQNLSEKLSVQHASLPEIAADRGRGTDQYTAGGSECHGSAGTGVG